MPNATPSAPLAGALGAFALTDVLQLLDLGARTGVLEVEGGPLGSGRVSLCRGRVHEVTVVPPPSTNRDAVDRLAALLTLEVGHWAFYPNPAAAEHECVADTGVRVVDLLLEATCRQDQRIASDRGVPDDGRVADSDTSSTTESDKLTGAELAVLAAVDGTRDVQAIADLLRRDREHVRRSLERLHTLRLVRPDDVRGLA